jgi:hypothetical protein
MSPREKNYQLFVNADLRGNSSVGRARPCQGRGREFESRFPLQIIANRRVNFVCCEKRAVGPFLCFYLPNRQVPVFSHQLPLIHSSISVPSSKKIKPINFVCYSFMLLSAVCCLLSAVCCLLSAVCCLLSAVCCLSCCSCILKVVINFWLIIYFVYF